MRKGITPIISIIVLLLITVALAGVAYTYLSGVIPVEQSFMIVTGSTYCSSGTVRLTVKNTGTTDISAFDVNTVVNASGAEQTTISAPSPAIGSGEAQELSGVAAVATGSTYTVILGTEAAVQRFNVVC